MAIYSIGSVLWIDITGTSTDWHNVLKCRLEDVSHAALGEAFSSFETLTNKYCSLVLLFTFGPRTFLSLIAGLSFGNLNNSTSLTRSESSWRSFNHRLRLKQRDLTADYQPREYT